MTIKKVLLAIVLVFTLFFGNLTVAHASGNNLDLKAESAMMLDAATGKILYEKNADTSLPPASMAKMMTEYIILEAVKNGDITWDQELKISEYAQQISQNRDLSNVPLRIDHSYKVKELYEAMAIYSANGATIALAELIGGSEKNFVQMMNAKAKKLKLKKYKFVNSTGLNNKDLKGKHPAGAENEENMLTARDTARLAYRLIKDHPEVLETAKITKKTFREGTDDAIDMSNWNWMLPGLVYGYEGVDGLKTGSTEMAGYSFAATAERNGMRLITVVMKTDSYKARFDETQKLLDFGFSNFEAKEIFPGNYKMKGKSTMLVVKGKENKVDIATKKPLTIVMKADGSVRYNTKFELDKTLLTKNGELTATVKKGQKVGEMRLTYSGAQAPKYIVEGVERESVDVVTTSSVEKASGVALVIGGIVDFFLDIFTTTADKVKAAL